LRFTPCLRRFLAECRAHLKELIAQACGGFEVQCLRRFTHRDFQFADQRFQFLA